MLKQTTLLTNMSLFLNLTTRKVIKATASIWYIHSLIHYNTLFSIHYLCLPRWQNNLQDDLAQEEFSKDTTLVSLPSTMSDNIPAQPFCQVRTNSIQFLWSRYSIKCQFLHIGFNETILKIKTTMREIGSTYACISMLSVCISKCCLLLIPPLWIGN